MSVMAVRRFFAGYLVITISGAAAEKAGLRTGLPKAGLDKEHLAAAMLLLEPELAWVGINIQGTLLVIEVVEKSRPPAGDERPAHLVAARDGLM